MTNVRSYKRITDTSSVLNGTPPTKKEKLYLELEWKDNVQQQVRGSVSRTISSAATSGGKENDQRASKHCINFAGAANFTVNFHYSN